MKTLLLSTLVLAAHSVSGQSRSVHTVRYAASAKEFNSQSIAHASSYGIELSDRYHIPPFNLDVSFNKTTHIIFPSTIKSVDRGSGDIIAEKAEGTENILKVKANKQGFEETNLSIVTADGQLYSFLVNYTANPAYVTLNLGAHTAASPAEMTSRPAAFPVSPIKLENNVLNERQMKFAGEWILEQKKMSLSMREKKNKIVFGLDGIYIKDEVIFYALSLQNKSNINFDVDFLRFYVRDKKVIKRSTTQEDEQVPLYIYNEQKILLGKHKTKEVVALPKFTIPDDKVLYVELFEKNGGRHMQLTISNQMIVGAEGIKTL